MLHSNVNVGSGQGMGLGYEIGIGVFGAGIVLFIVYLVRSNLFKTE